MTNRKSHALFRLVPKSTTFDDLEWSLRTLLSFGVYLENLNEDRIVLLSSTEMYHSDSSVCVCVCACVCMCIRRHSKTKTIGLIGTKLGRLIVHDKSCSPILFEVKRSTVKVGVSLHSSDCQYSGCMHSSRLFQRISVTTQLFMFELL